MRAAAIAALALAFQIACQGGARTPEGAKGGEYS